MSHLLNCFNYVEPLLPSVNPVPVGLQSDQLLEGGESFPHPLQEQGEVAIFSVNKNTNNLNNLYYIICMGDRQRFSEGGLTISASSQK